MNSACNQRFRSQDCYTLRFPLQRNTLTNWIVFTNALLRLYSQLSTTHCKKMPEKDLTKPLVNSQQALSSNVRKPYLFCPMPPWFHVYVILQYIMKKEKYSTIQTTLLSSCGLLELTPVNIVLPSFVPTPLNTNNSASSCYGCGHHWLRTREIQVARHKCICK